MRILRLLSWLYYAMKKGLLRKMSQGEYVLSLLSHSSKWRGYETTAKKVGHHLLHLID